MGPILCYLLRFFVLFHFRNECNTNSASRVHISINDQLRFFNLFSFSTNFVFVFVLFSFHVLRSIFFIESEMKTKYIITIFLLIVFCLQLTQMDLHNAPPHQLIFRLEQMLLIIMEQQQLNIATTLPMVITKKAVSGQMHCR